MVETDTLDGTDTEGLTLKQVIDGIITFAEVLSENKFHPYQRPLAYRMVESVLVEDRAHITALFSRQSGKSETVCNTVAALMVLLPRLAAIPSLVRRFPTLDKFKKGFWVGLFAPVEEQANTLFGRLTDRLTSEHAYNILSDSEIDEIVRGKSKNIRLTKSGSYALMMTANPKAKIESKTFHMVIIDEAQDCDDYVVSKSIMPMMAATAGTSVRTGTPNTRKCDFLSVIKYNKRNATSTPHAKQNHFEANWREVGKYNPRYRKFVEGELERLTEDSDEFQMSYCPTPDTRILTADLRHVRAGDIRVGDRLAGFDEERPGKGLHRRLQETVVEAVGRVTRPCYRLTFDDGTVVTCSEEHRWLVATAGGRTVWKATCDVTPADGFFKVCDVWDHQEDYRTGYLAAAFEGEGHFSRNTNLGFSQRDNAMLAVVRKYLEELNFTTWERGGSGTNKDVTVLHVGGGRSEIMRFLGQVRPGRLLDRLDVSGLGTIGRHNRDGYRQPRVVSSEFVGEQEVVAIRTSTRTYIAEGLASHNCLRWIIERGMFTTETRMDELGDTSMQELVKAWTRTPVVVGIDPAKTIDSTVVTVCWVDWDRPDEFGLYDHRVLNWLELTGVPLEQQYWQIVNFLEPYSIYGVAVDNQGMGMAVAERLAVLLRHKNCEVTPMNSNPNDQNKRWKHLTTLMDRGLIGWPAGAKVRRLRTWRRFYDQMTEAEKHFQGPNLMIAAPNEANAHDDYVDSLALAAYLTADLSAPEVEVISSPFYR